MNSEMTDKLQELLAFAKEQGLTELVWEEGNSKIAFRRGAVAAQTANAEETSAADNADEPAGPTDIIVKSPIVGIFRRTLTKNSPPIVMEGNHVKPGDKLGLVDCMKIPNDVLSLVKGKVNKILVQDGQTVEYGQPLFSIVENGNGEES
jgi:acetyl-CoA carboxylase biotin carboxyl carrier protein